MATWGVHLRVARCFIDNLIAKKYHREFVIGSVAPDCGYGVKDSFGEFTPPPKITHWSPSGMKLDCRPHYIRQQMHIIPKVKPIIDV